MANLRVLGVYCAPSVPNTTHVPQEIDQNYGLHKSIFCDNIHVLAQQRFQENDVLRITDLPLIVFGGEEEGLTLHDAFSDAFSIKANLQCWAKVGTVLLTRRALSSKEVYHQVLLQADGSVDEEADPETHALLCLEKENKMCCNFLSSRGYNEN